MEMLVSCLWSSPAAAAASGRKNSRYTRSTSEAQCFLCIFVAYCFLVDFLAADVKILFKSPNNSKNASDGTANKRKLLAAVPGHLVFSLSGLLSIGRGTTPGTLSLDSVPGCFRYKCLSQFGRFESCSPDSYQQRGELAVSGTNSKNKQKQPSRLQRASFWQTCPHLRHRYCCRHHPKQI